MSKSPVPSGVGRDTNLRLHRVVVVLLLLLLLLMCLVFAAAAAALVVVDKRAMYSNSQSSLDAHTISRALAGSLCLGRVS